MSNGNILSWLLVWPEVTDQFPAHVPRECSPLASLIPLFLLQPLDVQLSSPKHVGHLSLHGNRWGRAQGVSRWRYMRDRVRRAGGETRHTASQRLVHRLALQQLRPEKHQATFTSWSRHFGQNCLLIDCYFHTKTLSPEFFNLPDVVLDQIPNLLISFP